MEEDRRKLNIMEDMAEDRKQWRQLISCLTSNVGMSNKDDDDDDDDDIDQDGN